MILNRVIFFLSLALLLASFATAVFYPGISVEREFLKKQSESTVNQITHDLEAIVFEPNIEFLKQLPCQNCDALIEVANYIKGNVAGKNIISYQILNSEKQDLLFYGRSINRDYNGLFDEAAQKGSATKLEYYERETLQKNLVYISKINSSIGEYTILIRFDYTGTGFNQSYFNYILSVIFLVSFILFLLQSSKTKAIENNIEEVERYKQEIKLVRAESAIQNQFLANFTHELRTPLNAIIGFSGMLKDETLGSLGNPEYIKFSNEINNSGIHLLSIINDILDYSKAESGKLKVTLIETEITKIIRQSIAIVSPRAAESKVDLLESFFEGKYVLMLDPKRFKQVMLNLLSNAVKFTPESGSVKVSIFPQVKENKLTVEITDTGVGIAEKDIPTVMSLFGQVENNLTRKYEGTGIGLPFSKKLTNLMSGDFDIKSQVGVGTTISLTFPYDKSLNTEF